MSNIHCYGVVLYLLLLQVVGWPGMQISIPIEMIDEANQLASEFIQLEPVDSNNQVNG